MARFPAHLAAALIKDNSQINAMGGVRGQHTPLGVRRFLQNRVEGISVSVVVLLNCLYGLVRELAQFFEFVSRTEDDF